MSDETIDRLRALTLAVLMVVSVFGGTIAFSGAALAANVSAGNTGSPTDLAVSPSDDVVEQQISGIEITGSSGFNSELVLDISSLANAGVDVGSLTTDDISISSEGTDDNTGVSAINGNQITFTVDDADSDEDAVVDIVINGLDTSGASTNTDLTYTVSADGEEAQATDSFEITERVTSAGTPSDLEVGQSSTSQTITDISVIPGTTEATSMGSNNQPVKTDVFIDVSSLIDNGLSESQVGSISVGTVEVTGATWSGNSNINANSGNGVIRLRFSEYDANGFTIDSVTLNSINTQDATETTDVTYDVTATVTDSSSVTTAFSNDVPASSNGGVYASNAFDIGAFNQPTVENVQITSQDGNDNGLLERGETVTVSADVFDEDSTIDTVTADASAFGAGTVTLTEGETAGNYTGEFVVGDGVAEGSYDVTVTAVNGEGLEARGTSNELQVVVGVNIVSPTTAEPVVSSAGETVTVNYEATSNVANVVVQLQNDNGLVIDSTRETPDGSQEFTLSDDFGTGSYDVNVIALDETDSQIDTDTEADSVQVDNTSPDVTIQSVEPSDYAQAGDQVNVTFDTSDPDEIGGGVTDATVEILNGETVVATEGVSIEGATDGGREVTLSLPEDASESSYTVRVTAFDSESNEATATQDVFAVDNTPPTIESANVVDSSGDDITVAGDGETLTVVANATDNIENGVSTVTADVSTFGASADEITLTLNEETGLYEGDFTVNQDDSLEGTSDTLPVNVTAVDGVGLEATATAAELSVDLKGSSEIQVTKPTGTQQKESEDDLRVSYRYTEENPSSVVIELTNQDTDQTYTYTVDDSDYIDDGSTKSLLLALAENEQGETDLDDGLYNMSLVITDSAGNEATEPVTDAVRIDDTAPTVDLTLDTTETVPTDGEFTISHTYMDDTNGTVTITLTDAQNDENYIEYVIEDIEAADDASVTLDLSNPDVVGGEGIMDHTSYDVSLTAVDELGNDNTADATKQLTTNNAEPALESAETAVGQTTVTVTFSEGVWNTADGADGLDATDFAYTDANNAGAAEIIAVTHTDGSATAELTLDSEVTTADLSSDEVTIRSDAAEDAVGAIVPTASVVIEDTESPVIDDVYVSTINADNAGSYEVTGDVTGVAAGEMSVTLTDTNGDTVSTEVADVSAGTAIATLDANSLADGPVTIDVTLTDAGDNTATADAEVTKETVRPTIENVESDPGSTIVSVSFSEEMATDATASEFEVTGVDGLSVDEVLFVGQETVTVSLTDQMPADAFSNESVLVETTAEDLAGNSADDSAQVQDTTGPTVTNVEASEGSDTITLEVDEPLENGSSLTAEDFDYVDNSGDEENITGVEQTETTVYEITFAENVTAADRASDEIGLTADVTDLNGNSADTGTVPLAIDGAYPSASATADGSTVTITVRTSANLTADDTSLSMAVDDATSLRSLEGDSFTENVRTSINASDFSEVSPGVYEATVEVSHDDRYDVVGTLDSAGDIESLSATAEVDTQDPTVTDAVLSGIYEGTNFDGGARDTVVTVRFSEAVDASSIGADDISIEGYDGDIIAVQPAGSFGQIRVIAEGGIQTGTSPEVSVAGDSYTEFAGDDTAGAENGSTVVHTDVLDLSAGNNLVSVPAASGDVELSELDLSNVDAVHRYNSETGSWESFDPDAQENDFSTLESGAGYVFSMESADALSVNVFNVVGDTGEVSAPGEQTLTEGWNLVGHYQEDSQARSDALASLSSDSVFRVLGQTDDSSTLSYTSVSMTEEFNRGEAYWIFVRDDEVYTEAPFAEA